MQVQYRGKNEFLDMPILKILHGTMIVLFCCYFHHEMSQTMEDFFFLQSAK